MTPGWPDLLIVGIIALWAFKGFRSGLIGELAGIAALICATIAPWFYRGSLDGFVEEWIHIGQPISHVVAMFGIAVLTYLAVLLLARTLTAFARLPVIGQGNALGGAALGALKAIIVTWAAVYVALFLPLAPPVRDALHRSPVVHIFAGGDDRVDAALSSTLPPFLRPFVQPFFDRHRV